MSATRVLLRQQNCVTSTKVLVNVPWPTRATDILGVCVYPPAARFRWCCFYVLAHNCMYRELLRQASLSASSRLWCFSF